MFFKIAETVDSSIVTTDVFVKLTRKRLHLLFQMMPGFKANKFVDELVKATDGKIQLQHNSMVDHNAH